MLSDRRRWWLLAAIVLLLVALVSLLIPSYAEVCEKNAYTSDKECAAHYLSVALFLHIGQFLEKYAHVITGVATAILAIITWRLVSLGHEQSETTRAQLRAYLSVVIGQAVYQTDTLRFEAKPAILNNGRTPAYNVRYRTTAEILTDSVAAGYIFVPPPDTPRSQSSIGPGEHRIMSAILNHRVPDAEIDDIKRGNGKALWVWGIVHYDDVFGRPHFTQFCQRLYWLSDDSNIMGSYDGRFGLSD